MPDSIADGARCALMIVFILAATEKGQTLWARSAAWHPVMLVNRARRGRATALMSAALIADLAVVVLLVFLPVVGGVVAAVLVAAYTTLALPVHSGGRSSCRCLWKIFDTTTRPALVGRNASVFVWGLAATFSRSPGVDAGGVLYGAALLGGLGTLVAVLERLSRLVTREAWREPASAQQPRRDAILAAPFERGGTQ